MDAIWRSNHNIWNAFSCGTVPHPTSANVCREFHILLKADIAKCANVFCTVKILVLNGFEIVWNNVFGAGYNLSNTPLRRKRWYCLLPCCLQTYYIYIYCWVHGPLYVGFLSNRFWLSELYIKFSELYIKCFRTIYKIPRTIYKNNHPFWGYRPMHPLT